LFINDFCESKHQILIYKVFFVKRIHTFAFDLKKYKMKVLLQLSLFTFSILISLTSVGQINSTKKDTVTYNNFRPIRLAKIKYNKKAISHFGFGAVKIINNRTDTNTIFAITYLTNRWWINKYFAGGWFYDMAPTPEGGYSIGPQITGFAEFDGFLLPYVSFGAGFGYDIINSSNKNNQESRFYVPMILRFGGYIFFKKNRGFALFTEFNINFKDEN